MNGQAKNISLQARISTILLVLIALLGVQQLRAQNSATVQYFYDDAGRITKVVDQSGNLATYAYDSVGNLLSISRTTLPSPNALAILNFTPLQGAIGTTVTIQGQNFSTIASSNTVKFNGTPATVTAASANSLTVSVPSGATSGPITVAVGTTTATSATNFTVLQIPVITSISPKSALQGGSVSNFQVTGINLTGTSFSFLPAFSPAAITASGVTVSPDGTSASMSLTLIASAIGSFTLVGTNTAGSSSPLSTPSNTLTVLSTSPSADADGDGLTNIYEGAISSDPLNPSSANDGIPDGWALFFGLNPSSPSGGSQTAPDGLTYLQAFQQGLNPLIPSLAPPDVARVFPTDGATNYPTNGVVVVRFNEPLQSPATLAAAQAAINAGLPPGSGFSSTNAAAAAQVLQAFLLRTCCGGTAAVPGTVQLLQSGRPIAGAVTLSNDGLSLVFAPTKPLSSSTTYTVVVTGVKGAAGTQMSNTFQSSFTTGLTTNLTTGNAVLTSPTNGATDVPINAAFMVEFTKQVDPSSLTPQTFFVFDSQTNQRVPGMLQVDASGFTASFVPQTQYPVGRTMFVELTGVLDLTENAFPFSFFEFTTGFAPETQGPVVTAVSPGNGAAGIPTNSQVVAQFSEPLSVITAITGFQVLQGNTPVVGAIALSNGNTQLTFTPVSPLSPNTLYTISATSQISDVAENPLSNPGTFTFVTGAVADNTVPSVTTESPANGAGGVPTNAVIQVQFSKRVDPLTVTTADFLVFPQATFIPVAGTVSVSADGLTATFTPNPPLDPSTGYFIEATSGIIDLQGHPLQGAFTSFTTGLGAATTAPAVVEVSPGNGTLGVAVNPQIVVVVSAPVSAASVGSNAITVATGGTPVAGSISLSSDRTTLTFVPSSLLAVSTTYAVTVSGFADQAGNQVTPLSSTFTTGTSGVADTNRPSVATVSPVNGATGVPAGSNIVLTFNEVIDAATVNVNTVQIEASGFSGQLAGSYAVDATGKVVTFTPVSSLPGNTLIFVVVNGVTDLAGNGNNFFESTFTTGAGTDTTSPTVLMVTPGSGATEIGLNATVVLTFSKSLNRNTVNGNTVGLLVNGSKLGVGINVSADNRVVALNTGSLPASSTVTVVATTGVKDLAGNALGNFESAFSTASGFDTTHPAVVVQRPGNGATGVPVNTSVVLYVNEAMNAGTVQGALHVSQNGVLASGTMQVSDNGQVIVFTPSTPWQNGALVQVFMDGTAQDTDGNSLSSYQGSFRTEVDTTTVTPSVVSVSPNGGSNVPTNVVIDVGFNQALNAGTVNSSTVSLIEDVCCAFPVVPSTVSLINGGTVVQITPSAPLLANTFYFVQINTGLQGSNGLAFPFTQDPVFFETGTGTDTVAPTIVSVSPPNGSVNVGNNAQVRVVFSKPVNPLTVNSGSIQLTGGGTTAVADAISFSNNNQSVVLVPHAPLPDNTLMTLTIAGVTDVAGNVAATQTATFTTGTGPDLIAPSAVNANPFSGANNVAVNTPIMIQISEAIDPGTVNSNTLFIQDDFTFQQVAGTATVSGDGRTINFLPSVPLPVSRTFSVFFAFRGIMDLAGNQLDCSVLCNYSFTTGTTTDVAAPSVVGVSPANGLTGVPINAQVVVEFSEPVDDLTLSQITLSGGGGPVNVISRLSNANQTLTLVPVVPLNPNTNYTVSVSGVLDLSGNALTAPSSTTFTTGTGADLTSATVTTESPASGAGGVPTNALIQVQFSKRVDPLTVTTADFLVFPQATFIPVPGTVSVSADGLTATFTPNPPLDPSTGYFIEVTGNVLDLEGLTLQGIFTSFTTGLGAATTAPAVVEVSPGNGTLGVAVNPQIVVVVSAPVSAASVGSNAITVATGGTPVAGSISLSSDRTTLTFVPSSLLAVNTTYAVTVSGFADQAGNQVTPLSSTFTTGTSGVADTNRPSVAAVSPVNGATGVPAGSNIVLTFNEVIDAATVNVNTVQIEASGFSGQLAGSYAVDATGKVVTFTPVSSLPGNTLIFVVVNGVTDLAGNGNNFFESTFTTGAGTDTTSPTVLMVTPGSGATEIGLNATVVLTFSKSLNRNTVNGNTVGLLVNGSKLGVGINVSADNRVVALNTGSLPASSTVTVVATTGVKDLAGNALGNFESAFSTASGFDTTHPAVVVQRPGNGATGVPVNTSVVLYVNEAMNAGTVQGALHVSQNGVLASGTMQVSDNGQVIVFTPSTPWQNGALVQVFMDGTAQDTDGNSLSSYQGSFRTEVDTTTVTPSVVSVSPNGGSNVPTNVVIDVGFNQALNAGTVNSSTVSLIEDVCCAFPVVPSTVSLINGGTVVQITPSAPLLANTFYFVQINTGLQGSNGLAFPFTQDPVFFETGTGTNTVAPTIVSVSPPNGSVNVGNNAQVRVVFSKPVNPLTVNSGSIQLTGGGTTAVADAISFSNNNQSVVLVPHAPLPDNTLMTLTIAGVTDVAGNVAATQTATFTTGTGPDLIAPSAVNANPFSGANNVAVNTPIMIQISEAIDPGTVNSNTLFIQDDFTFQQVAGTATVSGDGRTINFLPSVPLPVSRTFSVFFAFRGIMDLAGNQLDCSVLCNYSFTTGTTTDVAAPSVVGVSPANGLTGVPINAQVVVEFSEPVDDLTLSQITLSGGGGPVNVISRLSNANQTLTLVPVVPLNPNTNYTVSVSGVLDLSGNALTAPSSTTFTTGTGADLTSATVTTESPASGAGGVPTNALIQVQFSKRVDPLTVTTADFLVFPQATFIPVPGTVSVSADGLTATFTPNPPLDPSTGYFIEVTGNVLDLEGLTLQGIFTSFTTGTQ